MYFITYPITVITCIFYTFTIRSCYREQKETVDLVSYQTIEGLCSANYMLSDIFTTLMVVTKCDVQDKSKLRLLVNYTIDNYKLIINALFIMSTFKYIKITQSNFVMIFHLLLGITVVPVFIVLKVFGDCNME